MSICGPVPFYGVENLNVAGILGSKEPGVWKLAYDTIEEALLWDKAHPCMLGGSGER
jgi:hypothetical protein